MSNQLDNETSLYLRQHADNPVDWWPWGDAALAQARDAGKPVLLSIGYSACHWCHVMAHESFESPAIATVMNDLFVNIKVDREQRPDLDKLYQLAHQALSGRGGGWPLTVFLDPANRLPFFAGTYFPPQPRHGLPGFVELLRGVRSWYDQHPNERQRQNQSLAAFLANDQHTVPAEGGLTDAPIKAALRAITASFDAEHGGHRGAPKFPHASELEFLLGAALADDAATEARDMALSTLAKMAEGGLIDHLGGGFFRYCVDEHWEIPHFEKMLYDNAQLLPLYARAASENESLRDVFERALGWLLREMRDPRGAFWSTLDADSEGEEGRYYVWQRGDIETLLDADTFAVAERRWGLDLPPNFEARAWHLTARAPRSMIGNALNTNDDGVARRLRHARNELLRVRGQRVRPGLDDKILTAWNTLLIGALAKSSQWLRQPELLEHAEAALEFIHEELWRDGRLLASHASGASSIPAFLDDYAFLLDAILGMLRQRWLSRDIEWAQALAGILLDHFEDRDSGGFWFTADDAEALPQRSKSFIDDALPSGNGVAARALLRLGHLLGETRYLDAAERCLRAARPKLEQYPHACCSTLLALDEFLQPRTQIVLRTDADELMQWNPALEGLDHDRVHVYRIGPEINDLPGAFVAQQHRNGGCAWVCTGTHCLPPITEPMQLSEAVRS